WPSGTVTSPATCPASNTLTCAPGGLSCSTGLITDCSYSSCAVTSPCARIDGAASSNYAGYGVGLGDVNGDGYADLVVCAYGSGAGGTAGAGSIYVVYGTSTGIPSLTLSTLNGTNGFRLDAVGSAMNAGRVLTVGDINGDGYADIVIGAALANSSAGYVYV